MLRYFCKAKGFSISREYEESLVWGCPNKSEYDLMKRGGFTNFVEAKPFLIILDFIKRAGRAHQYPTTKEGLLALTRLNLYNCGLTGGRDDVMNGLLSLVLHLGLNPWACSHILTLCMCFWLWQVASRRNLDC